jgi:hypothetical protein
MRVGVTQVRYRAGIFVTEIRGAPHSWRALTTGRAAPPAAISPVFRHICAR